jgi:hypothetical protein
MIVEKLSPSEWSDISENAHLVVFNEKISKLSNRIDFTLLAKKEDGVLAGYVTCREHDAETLYWQYGGAFPGTIKTIGSYHFCMAMRDWAKDRYKRVTMLIENTNKAMLKMAVSMGFIITGVRTYNGFVLLEHVLEFDKCA